MRAQRKALKPSIGLVRRFMARWSCSDDVVQVLDLAHDDLLAWCGIDGFQSCHNRAALIDGHFLRCAVPLDRLYEEPASRRFITMRHQQEIDGPACLIDGTVQYFHSPLPFMYVSSIRQLLPTLRRERRNAFSSTGYNLIAQRCTVE